MTTIQNVRRWISPPWIGGRSAQAGVPDSRPATPDSAIALLEFQSPTAAVIARPAPMSGRVTIWTIAAAVFASVTIMSVYPVDRVVSVPGMVVSKIPNIVIQPLDTSIVRKISVREGQLVRAGEPLVVLDGTFAGADAGALDKQVASLEAEVDRLNAESHGRTYVSDGSPASQLQAMIFSQRRAERIAKLESYRQRIDSAQAKVAQTMSDIASYAEQFKAAQTKEGMRRELERMQLGSKLSTLDARGQRAEVSRALQGAVAASAAAKSEMEALAAERDAYVQQTQAETAQQLTDQGRKLSEAREEQRKASLRRRLVDLRAEREAIVLSVAKVSVGSVVQSGDELITLVPTDAPLEVQASVPGRDAGFVQVGNPVVIKFDTFPYTTYGFARGTLTTVSADSFPTPQNGRERASRFDASRPEAIGAPTYYRARVSLDEIRLHNLPAAFRMTPGMPVTADIKAGQRTVMSYLLARVIPTLTEGMREP